MDRAAAKSRTDSLGIHGLGTRDPQTVLLKSDGLITSSLMFCPACVCVRVSACSINVPIHVIVISIFIFTTMETFSWMILKSAFKCAS